jgi:rSAM/selenodomain-associated transferase 1
MAADCLIVFLKPPRPGLVKTRLAAELGPDAAAELYRLLADETLRRTSPGPGDYERLLFFTPENARSELERWHAGVWIAQRGSSLGERLEAAFDDAFRRRARRVAIVGSDIPGLSREHVSDALHALDDHDVVIGPAHDGGYYLVALAAPAPPLFRGIPWSTRSVLTATVERAATLGLGVRLLEALPDVDTLEDVRACWPELTRLLPDGPLLQRLSAALDTGG